MLTPPITFHRDNADPRLYHFKVTGETGIVIETSFPVTKSTTPHDVEKLLRKLLRSVSAELNEMRPKED